MENPTEPTKNGKKARREWKPRFLRIMAETGNPSQAAKGAGINRSYAYEARGKDPDFALAWDDAEQALYDGLESELRKRTKKSDVCLIFALKGYRPDRFAERQRLEHSGPGGATIAVNVTYESTVPDQTPETPPSSGEGDT